MDYKTAFDLIYHNIFMSKLKDYKINPHILNWIHDFFSDLASVLRGSKLGPRLFLVITRRLLRRSLRLPNRKWAQGQAGL